MKHILILLAVLGAGSVQADPILPVETDVAGFVGMAAQGPLDTPITVDSYSGFTAVFGASTAGLANPYLGPSVAGFFANGGQSLVVVRAAGADDASLIGTDGGPGARTGLQALLDVDEVSIVAIPGGTSPAVQVNLIAHCQTMRDRMAILDPAAPADVAAVQAQRAGLGSDDGYAALYFPWIEAAPTGTSLLLPPSGFVAGWYSASEPPDSPVGLIATATGVAHDVTTVEQEILNPQGINAIRNLSGIRIWGARTLASDPEWQYVAARRMGHAIEESVVEGTQWALQEPNDFTLWNALVADVSDFLFERWLAGWFPGTTPDDGFFVQCGLGQTMTQTDIDLGRTVLTYGFAPLAPAEFIVNTVVQDRSVLSTVPAAGARLTLHPAAPNPFNPMTTLRYSLDRDARVSLTVYDAAGRRVRTVLSGRSPAAGNHEARWDGRDDRGRAAPSGVYLVQLKTEGASQTQRILLAR